MHKHVPTDKMYTHYPMNKQYMKRGYKNGKKHFLYGSFHWPNE